MRSGAPPDSRAVVIHLLLVLLFGTWKAVGFVLPTGENCWPDGSNNADCYDVHCPTDQNGFVCYIVGKQSFVMTTVNKGDTWTKQASAFVTPSTEDFYGIHCGSDYLTCYIAGSGGVIKTVDGGTTWVTWIAGAAGLTGRSIYCMNNQRCIAVGLDTTQPADGMILVTTDGGTNWATSGGPWTGKPFTDVHCCQANDCIVSTVGGLIYHTPDFGTNWVEWDSTRTGVSNDLNTVFCQALPSSSVSFFVYAAGDGGDFIYSGSNGDPGTFNTIILSGAGNSNNLRKVSCDSLDKSYCALVGDNVAYTTADGGTTWENHGSAPGTNFKSVDMQNFNNGASTQYAYWAGLSARGVFDYPVPPTRRRRVGVAFGDPVTYWKGKKTEFNIPYGFLTPMLKTPDMHILASPLPGRPGSEEQWIGSISVVTPEGGLVVQVDIKKDIPGLIPENISANAFETLEVSLAPRGSPPLSRMPRADTYFTHPRGHTIAFGRSQRQAPGVPRREGVVVTSKFAKVHVMSTSAREFYGAVPEAFEFAHLDLEIFDMQHQELFEGILPEIWGLKPMTSETQAMVKAQKPEELENELIGV